MKIINTIDKQVEFAAIKVGECFMYDKCLFIKMNPVSNGNQSPNAFCFVDNCVVYFKSEWHVTPVDAEITIHGKGVK